MHDLATEDRPLRPSSLGKLLKCPMSVILALGLDSEGNKGSNTGSLVHVGIEAFHKGGETPSVGEEAMVVARPTFPEADWEKAVRWYHAYAADPANAGVIARVPGIAVELPVSLNYKGVWIKGTLDQIRDVDGVLSVWDVKTGSGFLDPEATVAEHQAQQAAYVLAARETLKLDIRPGGIIYIVGYDKPRGRKLIPTGVSLTQCEEILDEVVAQVERIRLGARPFTPSADGCRFCPFKQYPRCTGITRDTSSND